MAFQRTDYLSLNRGGTPATAGGATGTYYVDQVTSLEKLIGIPTVTQLGAAPATAGPHAYIDDTANPDVLMIWDASANAYVPADKNIASFTYAAATRILTITDTAGATYTVTLPAATDTVAGMVSLAPAAAYPAVANDTEAATPAYVAAAIAALPGDKFLQGLQSYNAATNTMTLLMSDGSTVAVDMTGLISDAIAGLASNAITITGGGLATGGGDLTANRVISVTASTNAQAIAGTDATTVITPATLKAVFDAKYAEWMAASVAP